VQKLPQSLAGEAACELNALEVWSSVRRRLSDRFFPRVRVCDRLEPFAKV